MRVLLSTIGSRGDVQPLVALASALRTRGQGVRLCVPPDFQAWIESLGFAVTPIGPWLRSTGKVSPSAPPLTPERRRELADASVAAQFETVAAAAQDCDAIVAATALQIAARSVAETRRIPYVFTAYCPAVLPSPHHAPPVLGALGDAPAPPPEDYAALWARDTDRFNGLFGASLNAHRASLGLAPVDDVRGHVFTDRPWLAADRTLGPWPDRGDEHVLQTGAWILPDERPLSDELRAFLDRGDPPIYFGFGSIRATHDLGRVMIETARALGRRAIVSRGWADLALLDGEPDCLSIGEANLRTLFTRVAAIVHHGGAGTTTLAALAGTPQIVIPQMYDQHYWARRVQELGVGVAHAPGAPTTASLTRALDDTLRPGVAGRARAIAADVQRDGADIAAAQVMAARI
jgi:vancomycin aglycone glucosyltransferase